MRAPAFWTGNPHHPAALALAPLGALYAAATARRLAKGARLELPVPVICVGNINAGGTGKTPTVIALLDILRGLFHTPHVVTRGYGGSAQGPMRVDPARHPADVVGDEALLMAAFGEVRVAKDRASGARAAVEAGASVIVLDDGFQDPSLAHSLSIVVIDGETGFGNGRVIPAGPLREPAAIGLARADLALIIGDISGNPRRPEPPDIPDHIPVITGALTPLQTGMDWAGTRVLAFAGIGRPEKFFATLRGLGAEIVRAEALGDHARLAPGLLKRLRDEAKAKDAQLVTTEKDAARLPAAFRSEVITLPVRLRLDDPEPLLTRLSSLPGPDK